MLRYSRFVQDVPFNKRLYLYNYYKSRLFNQKSSYRYVLVKKISKYNYFDIGIKYKNINSVIAPTLLSEVMFF